MRWFMTQGAVTALLLTASATVAAPEPTTTCAKSPIAFGVLLDEAALALDDLYVDGVVPIPVNFGLQPGLTTLEEQSDLVTRALVQLNVTDASGTALAGSIEIVGNALVWVGAKVFEKNTTYELAYSFANDEISLCPQGVPQSGLIRFTTGQRSAAEDLAELDIDAKLETATVNEPGCCAVRDLAVVPSTTPCLTAGTCVACWDSVVQVGGASAFVSTSAPFSYYKIDFSLWADDRPQAITYQNLNNARFAVTDAAPVYCFQADLRPRGPVDAKNTVSHCVGTDSFLKLAPARGLTGLSFDACTEAPQFERAWPQWSVLEAVFGSSEADALANLHPPQPGPRADDVARNACALGGMGRPDHGEHVALFVTLAVGVISRRRSPPNRRAPGSGRSSDRAHPRASLARGHS